MKIISYKVRKSADSTYPDQIWSITYKRFFRERTIVTAAAFPSERSAWYYEDTGLIVVSPKVIGMIRAMNLKQFVKAASEKSEVHNP